MGDPVPPRIAKGAAVSRNSQRLRAAAASAPTKILLTSSVPVVENAAVHRGFGFLRKPYLAVTFKRRVRAILASAYPTALSTAYPNAG